MIPTDIMGIPLESTLRLIGIWPDSSCKFPQRIFWITVMLIWQFFQYWYIVINIDSEPLPDLMNSLSLCLSNSLLFFKLNILWLNRRYLYSIVYNIFTTMAEDWNEGLSTCSETQAMVTSKVLLSHRISKSIICAYLTCQILIATGKIFAYKNAGSEQSIEERQLFIKMQLPFQCNVSPCYESVVIIQFILQTLLALMAGMFNALIVAVILHISGQIDIMCYKLQKISIHDNRHDSHLIILKNLVNKHQRIIDFADNIEVVFCYMALMQFFANIFVICFLGFIIVTAFDSADANTVLMKAIPYYVVVTLEAFVLCYTGEYLTSKSRSIIQTAYESLWYKLKPREKKIFFLLTLRSQRQMTITAGKFIDLSLESFTSILKASASYISLLHAMYSKH